MLEVAFAAIRQGMPAGGRIAAFQAMRASLPEALRNAKAPFTEAVDVGDDAPAIDRLVAWNGRRPR